MAMFLALGNFGGKRKNTPINECKSYLSISCLFDLPTRGVKNLRTELRCENGIKKLLLIQNINRAQETDGQESTINVYTQ